MSLFSSFVTKTFALGFTTVVTEFENDCEEEILRWTDKHIDIICL